MRSIVIILMLFIGTPYVHGQKQFTRENMEWLQYYQVLKLNDRFLLKTDGGYRWRNTFQNNSQYIIRTGLGYRFGDRNSLSAGFAHLGFFKEDTLRTFEYRPYQEFGMNDIYIKLKIQHRFRIEERFFQTISTGSTSFNFRFRYRLFMSYSLFRWEKQELMLNLGDEIFLNAGKDIVYNVFDQNRLFAGMAFKFNKDIAVSLTYTKEVGASNAPNSYKNNNIFWLGIKHRIDLKKKPE